MEMEEQNKRLAAENKELETLVTDALQESRKLQESREGLRSAADNQQIELQKCREELEVFKRQLNEERDNYERVLPRLKELEMGNDAVEELREQAALVPLLREKMEESDRLINTGENQILGLQKEISRLKEVIEVRIEPNFLLQFFFALCLEDTSKHFEILRFKNKNKMTNFWLIKKARHFY